MFEYEDLFVLIFPTKIIIDPVAMYCVVKIVVRVEVCVGGVRGVLGSEMFGLS